MHYFIMGQTQKEFFTVSIDPQSLDSNYQCLLYSARALSLPLPRKHNLLHTQPGVTVWGNLLAGLLVSYKPSRIGQILKTSLITALLLNSNTSQSSSKCGWCIIASVNHQELIQI